MGELVSEDMLDWARDLAAIQKLVAGEELTPPTAAGEVLRPEFGAPQGSASDPGAPPQPPPEARRIPA
ncbi:MAG: hypothetical protein JOZ05_01570 [Acetobacteraceae bacterium]|nr:hypothetical protein [Acetobacteraceae bacterium]